METNNSCDNLTALTGRYPFNNVQGKPGSAAQHDPDICPRCGANRSAILQRVLKGQIFTVNCKECQGEINRRLQKIIGKIKVEHQS